MAGRVIQGFFIRGHATFPGAAVQPSAAPRVVAPPPTAFPGRTSAPPAAKPGPGGRPPAEARGAAIQQKPGAFAAQPRMAGEAVAIDPAQVGLSSGGGRPLPDGVRRHMEAALGADFSSVRVHVGPQAERIGALAFTIGSDLYFAQGRYQPDTHQGRQLLGHELAHVVQQRQGRVRNPLGHGVAVVVDRALETEAERLGERAASLTGSPAERPPGAPGPAASRLLSQAIQLAGGKGVRRKRSSASDSDEDSSDDSDSSSSWSSSSSSGSGSGSMSSSSAGPAKPPNSAVPASSKAAASSSGAAATFTPFTRAASFDPDANDSESDADGAYAGQSFNSTKKKARVTHKGETKTDRNDDGSRVIPRVNHYVGVGAMPNLADDAVAIRNAVPDQRSRGATTILCVIMLNERGRYVKYCFTNLNNTVTGPIRKAAEGLNYSVVSSPQAHAEGELISYMNEHSKRRLIAMGCDKPHCAECFRFMRAYFRAFASQNSTDGQRYKNYRMPKVLKVATGEESRPLPAPLPKAAKPTAAYRPTPAQVSAYPAGYQLVEIAPDGNCLFASIVAAGRFTGTAQALRIAVGNAVRSGTITANGFVEVADREVIAAQVEMDGYYNNLTGDAAPLLIAELLNLTIMIILPNGARVRVGHGTAGTVWLVRVTQPLEHFHLLMP